MLGVDIKHRHHPGYFEGIARGSLNKLCALKQNAILPEYYRCARALMCMAALWVHIYT